MGKNNSIEYKELEDYSSFLKDMLSKDQYISRKEYIEKHDALSDLINRLDALEKDDVLTNWCKKNKTEYKKLLPLIRAYKNTEKEIKKHNDNYVNKHLEIDKDYLDKVLIKDNPVINLDEEQRRVVLSDEDYTLVIAGAGAGKTTTIEAKAKYLVEKMNVSPERILVVSFTKKATDELIDRFKKLEIPVNISTFHSVGNTIIRDNDGERHKIVDQGFMYRAVEDYLINKLDDKYFIRKLLLFFASYLNMPFEEENTTLLYKSLAANDTTTIKNDLSKVLEDYKNEQTKRKITIKDETVRSIDEWRIANFLYIKGVDYVYEPVYQYCFDDTTKPYCPDFLIKNDGKEIYLEHFGITEDGKSNRYFGKELEEYKKRIKDKIEMHKKHGTRLIYTYSKYNDGRDLITHLEEILLTEGITFDAKDEGEIYRQLAAKAEDKYFTKFIMLVCNFINRFKVCNYDVNTKFDEWQYSIKNERTKLFLEIAKQCFYIYEAKRLEAKAIDFEDMINDAVNILDRRIKQQDYLPYDYIFVDEYQDI